MWLRFRAAQGVLRRRSGLLQAQDGFAARSDRRLPLSGTGAILPLAWRTQTDPAARGRGKPVTTKEMPLPQRLAPLSPLPYVSTANESASSRPHRHVPRSVRRRKDVQDRAGFGGGENGDDVFGWEGVVRTRQIVRGRGRFTPLCHFVTSPPQGGRSVFSHAGVQVREAQSSWRSPPLWGRCRRRRQRGVNSTSRPSRKPHR